MALAVSPGRDPDESELDRKLANVLTAALGLIAVGFAIWLIWVYLL
ncbi:MAG TPA: hypothetical protein VIJ70_08165 [Gaiellaceae bacterium]